MNCKKCGEAYEYECICPDCNKTSVSAVASNDGLATLERENAQLKAIIELMDKHTPIADSTCREPGIVFSEACKRQLTEKNHPLFTQGG